MAISWICDAGTPLHFSSATDSVKVSLSLPGGENINLAAFEAPQHHSVFLPLTFKEYRAVFCPLRVDRGSVLEKLQVLPASLNGIMNRARLGGFRLGEAGSSDFTMGSKLHETTFQGDAKPSA